ncbi:MAG: redox-sensing transcriptional repressor Rex [Dehalococcoidia bacterium]
MPIEIPDVVIDRLPLYYRLLARLEAEGRAVVSSQELGAELGVTPAQIRKDLSYFGRFGKQGRGYSVHRLASELRQILGLDGRWRVVVVGIGRLGRAIASYPGFEGQGFDIISLYDASPTLVGSDIEGKTVRDVAQLEDDLKSQSIDIGIVAVPGEVAQDVVDTLVHAGVRAILNYTPTRVQVTPEVELKHINPVLFLQSMTYHLKRARDR